MAAPAKKNKYIKDYVLEDSYFKHFIKSTESKHVWNYRWGWLLDEFKLLKAKMDEHTANSEMLKRITTQKEEDYRQLGKYPESTNHEYGYVCSNPEMQLETWGPDHYKPKPLPDLYKLIKGYS